MIQVVLVLENGLLKSCGISGHAGAGPKGADIVCAAVSVLAGTAHQVLSGQKGISVQVRAPLRGEFFLKIDAVNAENREFLAGAGTFLVDGLLSVSREYPEFCAVRIERGD